MHINNYINISNKGSLKFCGIFHTMHIKTRGKQKGFLEKQYLIPKYDKKKKKWKQWRKMTGWSQRSFADLVILWFYKNSLVLSGLNNHTFCIFLRSWQAVVMQQSCLLTNPEVWGVLGALLSVQMKQLCSWEPGDSSVQPLGVNIQLKGKPTDHYYLILSCDSIV